MVLFTVRIVIFIPILLSTSSFVESPINTTLLPFWVGKDECLILGVGDFVLIYIERVKMDCMYGLFG